MDKQYVNKLADELLKQLSYGLEGYAEYILDNGRVIWLSEVENPSFLSPHLVIELRCSESEWDAPGSEYFELRDPCIERYILTVDDKVSKAVEMLLQRNLSMSLEDAYNKEIKPTLAIIHNEILRMQDYQNAINTLPKEVKEICLDLEDIMYRIEESVYHLKMKGVKIV